MTNIGIIYIWCWWLLVLIQSISSQQAQFMSFCGQTLNLSPSLSILYKPSVYSSCCNITLSDPSKQITINILNMSIKNPPLQIFDKQMKLINLYSYAALNRNFFKTDILDLPITFVLCQLDIPSFEILVTNITKGPCKTNQYRCLTTTQDQWCIDGTYHCDGYHSCPEGTDENGCGKSMYRINPSKQERTIRGGIVTTIIVIGLLLIIASVSIAVAFVYFRRKNQRRRQFTYSLESTSDDWEPSGTGYRLFDNLTNNHRHNGNNIDNVIIDANEHMPIATNMTIR